MAAMSELKACPFCGTTTAATERRGRLEFPLLRITGFPGSFSVSCHNCRFDGAPSSTTEGTVALWNQRPEEDRLRSALQVAERERDEAVGALLEASDRSGIQIAALIRDRDHAKKEHQSCWEKVQRQRENLTNLNGRVNSLEARNAVLRTAETERDSARLEAGRLAQEIVEVTGKLVLAEAEVGRLREAISGVLRSGEDCQERGPACGNCSWCDARRVVGK